MRILNKRANIIQAAIEVFSEKGTDKTTISDIVKEAGIAQGTFYLYFPTKLAVMPAIAEVLVVKLVESFELEIKEAPIDKQLDQLIQIIFSHTDTYKELTKLVYTGLTQSPYLSEWEQIYDPLYQWIETLLLQAKEEQAISANLHTMYAAKILVGMIESAAEQIYLFDNEMERDDIAHREELHKMVCNALGISQ